MKNIRKCLVFAMILLQFAAFLQAGEDDTEIQILFTSSINGNLDGCDCHAVPRAGLVSSAVFLRDRNLENTILVDLGDFMDVYPDELLIGNILQVFKDLKYDLLALGDQEFTEGFEYLGDAMEVFPFISSNMTVQGVDIPNKVEVIERQGKRIGFASVIDSDVFYFYPEEIKEVLDITDINSTSATLLDELEEQNSDLKVLLFHGKSEHAKELFRRQEGWDVVLYAHDQQLFEESDSSIRYLASPGDNGNRVGVINISFSEIIYRK